MNRTEFLAALGLRLEDLPAEERNEAIKYYSEYLDEVGHDQEDAAIEELGGAEKVANIIRANCGLGPLQAAKKEAAQPELTLDGPEFSHVPKAPQPADAAAAANPEPLAAQQAAPSGAENAAAAADTAYRIAGASQPYAAAYAGVSGTPVSQNNNRLLWIILIVCTFPIWIGIVGGMFGVFAGIFATFVGLIFSGFAMLIAGIVEFVSCIALFTVSPANALATMGVSLLAAGCGALLGGGMLCAAYHVFPALCKAIGSCFGWISRKVGKGNA